MSDPKIVAWGDEIGKLCEEILEREPASSAELCGLAEQLVVNAASLLMTALLGSHKPAGITLVVGAGLKSMFNEVLKQKAAPSN